MPPAHPPQPATVSRDHQNVFNPPNPHATGMNFNNPNINRPPTNHSSIPNAQSIAQPSIGASLMDQEAVSLVPNLMGKKKKKKAKKKVMPNSLLGDDDDQLDLPPHDRRMGSLANAGASIGHASSYKDSSSNAAK